MTDYTYITSKFIQNNFASLLEQDIVRQIPEYENSSKLYFAHRDGCIFSINHDLNPLSAKILKAYADNNVDYNKSYYKVHISTLNDVPSHPFVHRLVAFAFLNDRQTPLKNLQHLVVNHIDGNRHNNRVSNLEWVDKQTNSLHAYHIQSKKPNTVQYRVVNTQTNETIIFNSRKQCALYFGVDKSTMTNVARRYRNHRTLYRQIYIVEQCVDPVIRNFNELDVKPHPKFANYYGTRDGQVISMARGIPKFLKPELTSSGYLNVTIQYNKKSCSYRVNRFVWECFNQQLIPTGHVIDHINGNENNDAAAKLDNRLENLRLVTQQQNVQHSCGIPLIVYMKNGQILPFKTLKECAVYFNVASATVATWLYKQHIPNPKHNIEKLARN